MGDFFSYFYLEGEARIGCSIFSLGDLEDEWKWRVKGVSILEIDLNFRDEKVYSFLHLWMGIKMYYPISREFIDIVHLDERRIEIYRIEILMLESGKFISI